MLGDAAPELERVRPIGSAAGNGGSWFSLTWGEVETADFGEQNDGRRTKGAYARVAAGTLMAVAIGLMIALVIVMKPELFASLAR